jgi:hypothetical protein
MSAPPRQCGSFLCPAGGECCRRLIQTAIAIENRLPQAQPGNTNSAPNLHQNPNIKVKEHYRTGLHHLASVLQK